MRVSRWPLAVFPITAWSVSALHHCGINDFAVVADVVSAPGQPLIVSGNHAKLTAIALVNIVDRSAEIEGSHGGVDGAADISDTNKKLEQAINFRLDNFTDGL